MTNLIYTVRCWALARLYSAKAQQRTFFFLLLY